MLCSLLRVSIEKIGPKGIQGNTDKGIFLICRAKATIVNSTPVAVKTITTLTKKKENPVKRITVEENDSKGIRENSNQKPKVDQKIRLRIEQKKEIKNEDTEQVFFGI